MATRWKAEYATGVALIDRQHEEIFGRADRLLAAMTDDSGEAELRTLFGFLTGYVHGHLRDEEALMAGSRYPNLALHVSQHTTFEDQLARLEARLAREGVTNALVVETATFVSSWLRGHIATSDQVFARYLERTEHLAPTVAPTTAPTTPKPAAVSPTPPTTTKPASVSPTPPPAGAAPRPDEPPVLLVAPGFEELELPPLPPGALRN